MKLSRGRVLQMPFAVFVKLTNRVQESEADTSPLPLRHHDKPASSGLGPARSLVIILA